MEPIVLTYLGETLLPQYPVPERVTETSPIRAHAPGLHQYCSNWVYVREISENYSAIVCNSCNMRILIPNNVRTFGDLRRHMWESWGRKANDGALPREDEDCFPGNYTYRPWPRAVIDAHAAARANTKQ